LSSSRLRILSLSCCCSLSHCCNKKVHYLQLKQAVLNSLYPACLHKLIANTIGWCLKQAPHGYDSAEFKYNRRLIKAMNKSRLPEFTADYSIYKSNIYQETMDSSNMTKAIYPSVVLRRLAGGFASGPSIVGGLGGGIISSRFISACTKNQYPDHCEDDCRMQSYAGQCIA
jgi:hypothetical protein